MKYLLIGAMPEEVSALEKRMFNGVRENIRGIEVLKGSIANTDVVIALSGVGKVNAAYTATTLIHEFNPEYVINIGSAGGLQSHQKVGDIVVATRLQYHDLDIGPETSVDPRFIFESNNAMVDHAAKIMTLPHHIGLMVTGDQFITKTQVQFETIQKEFPEAMCVEMEACAIAAVCSRSHTPFLVLRSLSDIPLEDENAMAFEEYLPIAAENSAQICETFIQTF